MHPQHNRVFCIADQPLRTSRHLTKGPPKVAKPHPFDGDHNASLRCQSLATKSAILSPFLTPCLRYVYRRVGNLGGDKLNLARTLTGEVLLVSEAQLAGNRVTFRQRLTR